MAGIEIACNGAALDDAPVSQCVHRTFAWGRADWLDLTLEDPDGEWGGWSPRPGDAVEARCSGARTGAMHVARATAAGGSVRVLAYSLPRAMFAPASRSWGSVRLHQICAQLAAECGMSWEAFGVPDRLYGHVGQAAESGMRLLARRLSLESATLSAFDGRLSAVGMPWAQSLDPAGSIEAEAGSYETADRSGSAYGSCVARAGRFEGEFRAGDGPVLYADVGCAASGAAEAARWARGLLRRANREAATAVVRETPLAAWLAAGRTVDASFEADPAWDGRYIASSVRHDYVAETTDVRLARLLEGY